MLAELHSNLTIGLGMKNYPKLSPDMLQSAHWFGSKDTERFSSMSAVLYCTALYCTVVFSKLLIHYTPLVEVNQAIYAWSFRQD